ncbi:MAG: hypothetical protein HWD92_10410 [Flavobacteriia bacterium]|nr:hypothetical protein [Flavobacteriia bacterium]
MRKLLSFLSIVGILAAVACTSNGKEGGPCSYETMDVRMLSTDSGSFIQRLPVEMHPFLSNGLSKDVTTLFQEFDQTIITENTDSVFDVKLDIITEGSCTPVQLSLK